MKYDLTNFIHHYAKISKIFDENINCNLRDLALPDNVKYSVEAYMLFKTGTSKIKIRVV